MAPVKMLVLVALILAAHGGEDASAWRNDFDAALDQASDQANPRPLALLFSTETCVWCHRMRDESDASPEVRQALREVVGVVVDAEKYRGLVARLGITGYPALVLVNRKQQLVRVVSGYQPVADLVTTLRVLALHGDQDGQRPAGLRGDLDIAALRAAPDAVARLVALLGEGTTQQRVQVRAALAAMPAAKDTLWTKLDDERLGVRVDAAAVLARLAGDPPGYDPFAPAAERQPAITKWREQLALPGGVVP